MSLDSPCFRGSWQVCKYEELPKPAYQRSHSTSDAPLQVSGRQQVTSTRVGTTSYVAKYWEQFSIVFLGSCRIYIINHMTVGTCEFVPNWPSSASAWQRDAPMMASVPAQDKGAVSRDILFH